MLVGEGIFFVLWGYFSPVLTFINHVILQKHPDVG